MKTKDDIKTALTSVVEELSTYIKTIDDATFKKSNNGKWSISENIDHLTVSNNITALGFNTPKIALKQFFKINNRSNCNYDEIVWKYQRSLSEGATATFLFVPKFSSFRIRKGVEKFWENSSKRLINSIDKWTEEELDTYLISHPILGKITARELLFFSVYHIQHHLKTIKNIAL